MWGASGASHPGEQRPGRGSSLPAGLGALGTSRPRANSHMAGVGQIGLGADKARFKGPQAPSPLASGADPASWFSSSRVRVWEERKGPLSLTKWTQGHGLLPASGPGVREEAPSCHRAPSMSQCPSWDYIPGSTEGRAGGKG